MEDSAEDLVLCLDVQSDYHFCAGVDLCDCAEKVGLNLQATGDFAMTWNRPVAVLVPLLVTFGCILLTCFSKRPLFPWLVSIFTLAIPMLIWFINVYPA